MHRIVSLLFALLSLLASAAVFAQTTYVFCEVKANGTVLPGNAHTLPNTGSINVQNYIPILSFNSNVTTAREAGSGMATGRRIYDPVTLVKMFDQTSPLLFKALVMNQNVDCICKFFRTAMGSLEHYFTVQLENARLSGLQQTGNAQVNNGMREMVQMVFQTITITDPLSGNTHSDTFSSQN
jgi:type VI secretion system secreted protein Hcp